MYEKWEQTLIDKISLYRLAGRFAACFAGAILLLLVCFYFAGAGNSFHICMKDYRERIRKRRLVCLIVFLLGLSLPFGGYANETGQESEEADTMSDTIVEDSECPLIRVDYNGVRAESRDRAWLGDVNSQVTISRDGEVSQEGVAFLERDHQVVIEIREDHLSFEDIEIRICTWDKGDRLEEAAPGDYELGDWTGSDGIYTCRLLFKKEGSYQIQIRGQDQYGNLLTPAPDFSGELKEGCYDSPVLLVDWTAPVLEAFLVEGRKDGKISSSKPVHVILRVREEHFHGQCLSLADEVYLSGNRQAVMTEEDYGLIWHAAGRKDGAAVYETGFDIKEEALHRLKVSLADPGRDPVPVKEKTVIYDQTPPEFQYSAIDPEVGDVTFRLAASMDAEMPFVCPYRDYRYFSPKKIFVHVRVRDEISGVRDLSYSFFEKGGSQDMSTLTPRTDSFEWSVWLPAPKDDFKGYLKAFATDLCGNRTKEILTEGMVAEGEALHETVSSIEIDESDLPPAKQGFHYCRSDIRIRADYRDEHSGLKTVRLILKNKKDGRVVYEKSKNFAKDGEKLTKNARIDVKIPISDLPACDQSHPVVVCASLEDNAGHRSRKNGQEPLVIDDSKPVVSVEYDHAGARNGSYYNKERRAVIKVQDLNFAPDQTRWMISGPESGCQIGAWEKSGGSYRCELVFTEDAKDYRLAFSLKDYAGNETHYEDRESFTIDTKKPDLRVEIPGKKAQNEFYYPETKVLTFRIWEDNPDEAHTKILLWYRNKKKKEKVRLEEMGKGEYRAACDKDGVYSIEFSSSDLAGNTSSYAGPEEFVIDTEGPRQISCSLEEGRTFAGMVCPKIVFEDDNFDRSSLDAVIRKIDFTDQDHAVFEPDQVDLHGKTFACTWNQFREETAADGVYRLSVRGKDLAGNSLVSGNEILFRINREGTVFFCDKKYQNKNHPVCLKQEPDLSIRGLCVNKSRTEVIVVKNQEERSALSDDQVRQKMTWIYGGKEKYRLWQKTHWEIAGSAFAEEGDYRVIVKTKEYDQTDPSGKTLVETDNEIRGVPVRFIVDKTPPTVYLSGLDDLICREEKEGFRLTVIDNFSLDKVKVTIRGGLRGQRKKTIILSAGDFDEKHSVDLPLLKDEKVQKVSCQAWDHAGNTTLSDRTGDSRTCILLPGTSKAEKIKEPAGNRVKVKRGRIPIYPLIPLAAMSGLSLLALRHRRKKRVDRQENVD